MLTVAALAALVSSVASANAATLGGVTSAELLAVTHTSVSVPVPGSGSRLFSFRTPGSLQGVAETNGWTWTVHTGSYTSNGSVLTAGTSSAVATVDTHTPVGRVVGHLAAVSGNRSGGVAANVDEAGTRFVAAVTEQPNGGRVRLLFVNGTTVTQLAQVNQVGSPTTLGIAFTGTAWVVTATGRVVLTHTATAAQRDLLGANTRFGVFNNASAAPMFTAVEFP